MADQIYNTIEQVKGNLISTRTMIFLAYCLGNIAWVYSVNFYLSNTEQRYHREVLDI
jgi:hypothetical protein